MYDCMSNSIATSDQQLERISVSIDGCYVYLGHTVQRRTVFLELFDIPNKVLRRYPIRELPYGSRTWYVFEIAKDQLLIGCFKPNNINMVLKANINHVDRSIQILTEITKWPNDPDHLCVGTCQWGPEAFILHHWNLDQGSHHEIYRIHGLTMEYDKNVSFTLPVGPLGLASCENKLYTAPHDTPLEEIWVLDIDDGYRETVLYTVPDTVYGFPDGSKYQLDEYGGILYLLVRKTLTNFEIWKLDLIDLKWTKYEMTFSDLSPYSLFSIDLSGFVLIYSPTTVYQRREKLLKIALNVPSLCDIVWNNLQRFYPKLLSLSFDEKRNLGLPIKYCN